MCVISHVILDHGDVQNYSLVALNATKIMKTRKGFPSEKFQRYSWHRAIVYVKVFVKTHDEAESHDIVVTHDISPPPQRITCNLGVLLVHQGSRPRVLSTCSQRASGRWLHVKRVDDTVERLGTSWSRVPPRYETRATEKHPLIKFYALFKPPC